MGTQLSVGDTAIVRYSDTKPDEVDSWDGFYGLSNECYHFFIKYTNRKVKIVSIKPEYVVVTALCKCALFDDETYHTFKIYPEHLCPDIEGTMEEVW